jgi:pimeloyl-ACP methyl ester carboxylesterase
VAESKREDKALFDLIQAMAAEIGPADFVAQQKAIMGRADSRPTLAEINCPSLVLCGGQDELTPPELSLELYRGIGNSELHILAGIGHMAPLEHPDLVAALLERMLVERL